MVASSKKYNKVVVIKWGDAFVDTDDFDPKEDTGPVVRNTVGWLVAKNQHGYILCTDTFDEDDDVNTKMFIPKGMVISVKKLTSCEDS